QGELIDLAGQVGAEAVVGVLGDQGEAAGEVDLAGGGQRGVGPERHPLVPGPPGEREALIGPPAAQPPAARRWGYQPGPELCGRLVGGYADTASPPLTVLLSDPCGLPGRVVSARVICDDPRDERLEGSVPAELGRVDLAVRHHHPAEIAGLAEQADAGRGVGRDDAAGARLLIGHGVPTY